ncbi:peptidoglycan editing factor PgeF [Desulfotomaculum copahuensis]|uniref:Purine nucleoside phosphorylase n=1 Tax=Desulfotomaculum copahuensis TaxID=1838280 RepID=A0A1B7LF59_9FIRM|nr:peptidoglycan editing factor PgeF [Desulfotomaculum copahuensis]OAT81847.1 multicopper polyphenol oxidase [Desulfotomaculum copahuensis]
MSGFTLVEQGGLKYLVIDSFQATGLVAHAFTTRCGGVSGGDFAALNLGFNVPDDPVHVLSNRAHICTALGWPAEHLVAGRQVHGDRVAVVTGGQRGRGAKSPDGALPDTDALITGERRLPLASFYADCVPVFLFDPVQRVIGLAHAGWKGTCLRIAEKTVHAMQSAFGTRPPDCLAGIGPSIGPCCYEVDEPVLERLRESFSGWPELVRPAGPGRWYLNLQEANRRTLLDAGLPAAAISVAGLCTACHPALFFSHRGSGGRTGRMASLLMLL